MSAIVSPRAPFVNVITASATHARRMSRDARLCRHRWPRSRTTLRRQTFGLFFRKKRQKYEVRFHSTRAHRSPLPHAHPLPLQDEVSHPQSRAPVARRLRRRPLRPPRRCKTPAPLCRVPRSFLLLPFYGVLRRRPLSRSHARPGQRRHRRRKKTHPVARPRVVQPAHAVRLPLQPGASTRDDSPSRPETQKY